MRTKICIHLIFISFFIKLADAQQNPEMITKPKEFNLSVFAGFSSMGPQNDMESNMKSSGLGQTSPSGWFSDAKHHPFTSNHPITAVEATYYFSREMGVSLNGGIANNIEVFGYQNIGIGNHMFLKSKIWLVSLNYSYRFKDNRNSFFIGPSYFIHQVKQSNAGQNQSQNKNIKLGANIGYSLQILQKEQWFIALKASYNWAPKSQTGSFTTEHQLGIATSTPETYTSVFKSTKVSLACLNFGICVGLRIATEK